MWKIITAVIVALVLSTLVSLFVVYLQYNNKANTLEEVFTIKKKHRTAFFDGMKKIISSKVQISQRNDSSFLRVVTTVMEGRKDSEGVMMKWITEQNPTAQYSEVSALYKDLSRTIEAKRDGFVKEEENIMQIVQEYNILLRNAPSSWFLSSRRPLEYDPIQSYETQEVMKSGIEENAKIF